MSESHFDIAVIGGGPAGSTAGLYLTQAGFRTCVIEKRNFPREILCGEFLSREVTRILGELELVREFQLLHPNPITSFRYCPEDSRSYSSELSFTAYGLKRGTFDSFLLDHARARGAEIYQPATVEYIHRAGANYDILLSDTEGKKSISSRYVVGAYGKSNPLDKTLHRTFRKSRSRLNGIKFHILKKYLHQISEHEIQLYTGRDMYCGVNVVNDDTITLCFLEERSPSDAHPRARIAELFKTNRHFAQLVPPEFEHILASIPIYGTGDIYFGKKECVENGIFMIGDAARVIAPLAGDGIGMAMESAKIFASVMDAGRKNGLNDDALSLLYSTRWRSSFQRRIRIARKIQQLLLSRFGKNVSRLALAGFPSLLSHTIEYTRG